MNLLPVHCMSIPLVHWVAVLYKSARGETVDILPTLPLHGLYLVGYRTKLAVE